MGTTRKPAAEKRLKGDNELHKKRWAKQFRDRELAVQDSTAPLIFEKACAPDWMTPAQARAYKEMLWRAHKDVICEADVPVLEMLACLIEFCRRVGYQNVHPNVLGKFMTCLDKLGMTPVARGKVAAAARIEKEVDPLDEFADA